MRFSLIYSVDVPEGIRISDFAPKDVTSLGEETEDDSQYEYGYLEGRWTTGQHRKWSALLDRRQFEEFVDRCGLIAEPVETLGSLGAPGCGYGWAPAISFHGDSQDAIQSAYVTPLPETTKRRGDERDWDRIRRAILARFGRDGQVR